MSGTDSRIAKEGLYNGRLIELRGVSLRYRDNIFALRVVDVSVDKGEFVFIVGPTGSGKSSLLKLVYLDAFASAGKVLISGKDVTRIHSRQVPYLRRNIGVVFQDFKLLSYKTAFENVAFALEVTCAPPALIQSRVSEMLDTVGLTSRRSLYPHELSGGEQQKTAIARALVNKPAILLADEPTGNLDPQMSIDILNLLLQLNKQNGTTVVVATHDALVVNSLRQRVITLSDGKIFSDEPRGVYQGVP